MAAAGLGIMALTGGFKQTPVEGGPITDSLMKPAAQRMREDSTERENYIQNLPGVKYNEKGEPIYGESTPLPAYTSPGFATATSFNPQPTSSTYMPPVGTMSNSAGGIYQPYNNSNMYTNLLAPPRRYAYVEARTKTIEIPGFFWVLAGSFVFLKRYATCVVRKANNGQGWTTTETDCTSHP
jgi:hypothetical protein